MNRLARMAAIACGLLALTASGCGKGQIHGVAPANERPTVRLTQAPASTTQPYYYAYELRWSGADTDGRVVAFEYAIDPPTRMDAETSWVRTPDNRVVALFRADIADSARAPAGRGLHTFVVRAIDDRGAVSEVVHRDFNAVTVVPTARILQPLPQRLLTPLVAPSLRLVFTGTDPDGFTRSTPVKFKYKVIGEGNNELDFVSVLVDPDTLRRRWGPYYTEWDSVAGDVNAINLQNLAPERRYVVALVAFDEVGASTTSFTFDTNLLYMYVSYIGTLGPRLTVFNESFYYQFPSGSFSLDPLSFIRSEAPAGRPVRIRWRATPQQGSFMTGYRWMVDGDVGDETPRSNETTDLQHWSQWAVGTEEAVIPAFDPPPGQTSVRRYFYLQARDNNDATSLAVVELTLVKAAFDRPLLFVDDARLTEDKRLANGTIDRPRGQWPTAAELDTFFFARGGNPWNTYPTGTVSPPGVFLGYDFDTIGTRHLRDGEISLEELGHYRHVVWYTDSKSPLNPNPPSYGNLPTSTLHVLGTPGKSNVLATWVTQGGKLWVFGGGIALSLQREWERSGSASNVFSSTDGELVPGRMMYDLVRWQSEIQVGTSAQATQPVGGIRTRPGDPDWTQLPPYLFGKSAATDPINIYAPNRTSSSDYYQNSYPAEVLSKPNVVEEDFDPSPDATDMRSVVDTLYVTVGGPVGSDKPVMTIYRGQQGPPLVMSGFPLWHWRREHQLQIADFVLQRLWGLTRENVPR